MYICREILLLFCRAVYRQDLVPDDVVVSILIESLIQSSQTILIEQLIVSEVIPISSTTACSLLADPQTQQLGLDMLKRGGGLSLFLCNLI